jgi:ribosomal protein L35
MRANKSHILTKKTEAEAASPPGQTLVDKADEKRMNRLLPNL